MKLWESFIWNDELVAELKKRRQQGKSLVRCSEEMGIDYKVISKKAQELKLNRKMNSGILQGPTVKQLGDRVKLYLDYRERGYCRRDAKSKARIGHYTLKRALTSMGLQL